jgi:hypothetical protein
MNLLGQAATEQQLDGVVLYTSSRWPFQARVTDLGASGVIGQISSGGYVLVDLAPQLITPDAMAAQLDAASKAIFNQAAWYQVP